MSTDDPNKPKRRRLQVTEEALGENEMFRFKRWTVTRPIDGASEDDLQEFDEQMQHSEQTDIPFAQRLVSDWKRLEVKLGELGYPPPRGWGWEREDHSWEPLSEEDNARMATEYGTMAELHDPNTGFRIEKTANYIKRHTEKGSRTWWLGHLGDLIIRILNEPDPDREQTHIYHYGCERQRYLDQQGHLDNAVFGRERREQLDTISHQPKRRPWAEKLAEQVTSWEEIPDDRDEALEIWDANGECRIFRDGDTLVCNHSHKKGTTEYTLKRSSFEKRYLKSGGKRRGQ